MNSQASWFSSLRLHSFRSYTELDIRLKPGVNVLFGANGAGKTNFLESLSLFSPGRGLRKANNRDFAHSLSDYSQSKGPVLVGSPERESPKAWAVSARLHSPFGQHQMGTGIEGAKAGQKTERRIIRVDGTTLKGQSSLPAYLSVLWLTPRMDSLFIDPTSERRGFLDQLVMAFDPNHARELAAYLHSMRERGRLLRLSKQSGRAQDEAWLSSLEDSMARHGLAIAAARRTYVRQLAPVFALGQEPFPGGSIALQGHLEKGLDQSKALALEDQFREELARLRHRDAELGRASLGPHTSDMLVWNSDHGRLAADCSTGEQKALLVALMLAHGRLLTKDLKRLPVYLLDEVAAHFDKNRRDALFLALVESGAQVFLTGTERAAFSKLEGLANFLEVKANRVESEAES